MTTTLKAGAALAALAAAALTLTAPVQAADLGGSIKDGYVSPMPEIVRSAAGPCYVRGDLGYSWSTEPKITWPVNSDTITGYFIDNDTNNDFVVTDHTSTHITDAVTNTSRDDGVFGEIGAGCTLFGSAQSGRALRAELMVGFRGNRKIDGEPGIYTRDYVVIEDPNVPAVPPDHPDQPDGPIEDPLHTSLKSYTLMVNAYKDLGRYGNFTPYVGAGVGVAFHDVGETYFTGNYDLLNRIEGDESVSFAWALMAGVGYNISDRAILDIGYRYIDMGDAKSGRVDSAGFVNPQVDIEDLTAHEIKIGLRYHFGSDNCCAYAPMK